MSITIMNLTHFRNSNGYYMLKLSEMKKRRRACKHLLKKKKIIINYTGRNKKKNERWNVEYFPLTYIVNIKLWRSQSSLLSWCAGTNKFPVARYLRKVQFFLVIFSKRKQLKFFSLFMCPYMYSFTCVCSIFKWFVS